jgi:Gas vesicle protein K
VTRQRLTAAAPANAARAADADAVPEAREHAEPRRISYDRDSVERGLVTLVLTVVELLRQLMERQALRRVEDGTLNEDKIEEIGETLLALDERMSELTERFGLTRADLNLDLGPLGPLLPQ